MYTRRYVRLARAILPTSRDSLSFLPKTIAPLCFDKFFEHKTHSCERHPGRRQLSSFFKAFSVEINAEVFAQISFVFFFTPSHSKQPCLIVRLRTTARLCDRM